MLLLLTLVCVIGVLLIMVCCGIVSGVMNSVRFDEHLIRIQILFVHRLVEPLCQLKQSLEH